MKKTSIEVEDCMLLTTEEATQIYGGGFWEDLGELVGEGARYLWDHTKNMKRSVRSVGPGVPV